MIHVCFILLHVFIYYSSFAVFEFMIFVFYFSFFFRSSSSSSISLFMLKFHLFVFEILLLCFRALYYICSFFCLWTFIICFLLYKIHFSFIWFFDYFSSIFKLLRFYACSFSLFLARVGFSFILMNFSRLFLKFLLVLFAFTVAMINTFRDYYNRYSHSHCFSAYNSTCLSMFVGEAAGWRLDNG